MTSPTPGNYSSTGVFVCFEGGDGSGKSTQSAALHEALVARGMTVVRTRQPGGTATGQKVRGIVLDPANRTLSDRTEALLYAADKAEHVHEVVLPALGRGEIVITDRYVDSALAYQGSGRDLEPDDVEWVNRWATHDLRPHLTVVLDLEPEQGLGRFDGRDRIEGEPVEFHERVRQAFLRMAAAAPEHYLVLDARRPALEITEAVLARLEPLLGDLTGQGRGQP